MRTLVEDAEGIAEKIRGARLEVCPGAGHLINLEQPGRFHALCREFLAGMALPQG